MATTPGTKTRNHGQKPNIIKNRSNPKATYCTTPNGKVFQIVKQTENTVTIRTESGTMATLLYKVVFK